MKNLQGLHVLILGLGDSGLAMARWCARCGAQVTVADTREKPPQLATLQADVPSAVFVAGPFEAALLEGSDIRAVFTSPGLSPAMIAPVWSAATTQGLWTGGELSLFSRALADLREGAAHTVNGLEASESSHPGLDPGSTLERDSGSAAPAWIADQVRNDTGLGRSGESQTAEDCQPQVRNDTGAVGAGVTHTPEDCHPGLDPGSTLVNDSGSAAPAWIADQVRNDAGLERDGESRTEEHCHPQVRNDTGAVGAGVTHTPKDCHPGLDPGSTLVNNSGSAAPAWIADQVRNDAGLERDGESQTAEDGQPQVRNDIGLVGVGVTQTPEDCHPGLDPGSTLVNNSGSAAPAWIADQVRNDTGAGGGDALHLPGGDALHLPGGDALHLPGGDALHLPGGDALHLAGGGDALHVTRSAALEGSRGASLVVNVGDFTGADGGDSVDADAEPRILVPPVPPAESGYAPKVLAITGTNGKTTVTSLTGQLVERGGKSVAVAGNIGPTLLDTLAARLDANDLPDVWVLELSSFQLHGVNDFEPTAGTVLNLSQDHLDWHGNMQAYGAAKANVFGQRGVMLLNREDPQVMAMLPAPVRLRGGKMHQRTYVTFGADMPQRAGDYGIETVNGMAWLVRAIEADETLKKPRRAHVRKLAASAGHASAPGRPGDIEGDEEELFLQRFMPADALRIRGRHNAVNALSALALAQAAGCALGPMLYGLRDYRGEPHRVESIGMIGEVEYFDDSKGTNVGATVAALTGLGAERRVVVILGGEGKGQDFAPLAGPVQRFARAVVLIGRDAPLIRAALEAAGVPLDEAGSMHDAVSVATQRAHAGDAVLMSPACASFDMFRDYGHRAEVFVASVKALADLQGLSMESSL